MDPYELSSMVEYIISLSYWFLGKKGNRCRPACPRPSFLHGVQCATCSPVASSASSVKMQQSQSRLDPIVSRKRTEAWIAIVVGMKHPHEGLFSAGLYRGEQIIMMVGFELLILVDVVTLIS